ncbi:uncharacterized protein LOC112349137 [Selaginella moellendorffii]|uniref:uncharacterized protein LOC112349137 n=1 Tax=Selaginella moellendorffii TaxID=88036 RepID=UPI000D1CDC5E|nr:uncharacterized protein LOC112349137 [Selaginella moellendorffii]|eukprot:XP_024538708.1 uncharacterized protein LOC112349137 [Selaginella moellendorffii]
MISEPEENETRQARKSEVEQCSQDFVAVDVDETAPSAIKQELERLHERRPDSLESNGAAEGRVCRVCHLPLEADVSIELGCSCKNELAVAHQRCAATWTCEICGRAAENVSFDRAIARRPDHLVMSVELNVEMQEENSYTVKRALCNLLLSLCVVIPFLPWLFRVHLLKL